jgi:hypothetical protein
MAAFYNDREDEACAIDDIVTRMRRIIDQLPAPKRELMMASTRSRWSDNRRLPRTF